MKDVKDVKEIHEVKEVHDVRGENMVLISTICFIFLLLLIALAIAGWSDHEYTRCIFQRVQHSNAHTSRQYYVQLSHQVAPSLVRFPTGNQ